MTHGDVAIVGGGAIGSSIAFHLVGDAVFAGRVTVVERDPGYRQASSALSASSIRQQFSTPLNIHLSRYGVEFLRRAPDLLGVDLALNEMGYLFLADAGGEAMLRANNALQRAEGCAVELVPPAGLAKRFPWISTDGLALASLGTANEGWFDGPSLTMSLRRAARERGAVYIADEAVGLGPHRVDLRTNGRLEAETIVIAAGAWSAGVAALARIALPVEPRRRSVFVFDVREAPGPTPVTIDPSGVWFRPEGRFYIAGTTPAEGNDPAGAPLEVQHQEWDEMVWPALAARVPAFEAAKVVNAWAGYYEYNTFDQNGIVGRHPEIGSIIFATGFSGHGLQQSPAIGRAVAELIVHGSYQTLDLLPFGYERISAGRPIRELSVV
ncbi:FAD-binding oxidoreductase [Enhydrobacter sp.]|jgi:glycine/D-amino acid oxidase-like deaminating enzyme|uniref:NAD(P)/FAD-dependent oxidoreductase n=1 Tax=Enhydrobacter sp. TaxID=1894999 RepID=UPI00262DD2FF|nr:FAD-binding oxidoreductase [Enhydrobacter sp.]WIM13094.1 MAG: Glycine/D-amino acid oxidases (deaminating) [Enhydrobacter sp.]